jgi:hypothetical protein
LEINSNVTPLTKSPPFENFNTVQFCMTMHLVTMPCVRGEKFNKALTQKGDSQKKDQNQIKRINLADINSV